MAKIKAVELGTHEFTGATITEAKANRDAAIWVAFVGDYRPHVIVHRGITAIVWREVRGWAYKLIYPDYAERLAGGGKLWGCSDQDLMEGEAVRRAYRHLADMARANDDALDYVPDFVTDPEDRRDHISKSIFCARYRHFIGLGETDNSAHAKACEPSRHPLPEFDAAKAQMYADALQAAA